MIYRSFFRLCVSEENYFYEYMFIKYYFLLTQVRFTGHVPLPHHLIPDRYTTLSYIN